MARLPVMSPTATTAASGAAGDDANGPGRRRGHGQGVDGPGWEGDPAIAGDVADQVREVARRGQGDREVTDRRGQVCAPRDDGSSSGAGPVDREGAQGGPDLGRGHGQAHGVGGDDQGVDDPGPGRVDVGSAGRSITELPATPSRRATYSRLVITRLWQGGAVIGQVLLD